jgi:hypothetical protein
MATFYIHDAPRIKVFGLALRRNVFRCARQKRRSVTVKGRTVEGIRDVASDEVWAGEARAGRPIGNTTDPHLARNENAPPRKTGTAK